MITWWTVDMEHDMNLLPGDDYLMNCWYGAWHEPVTRWWADAPVMLVDAVVIGYLMDCSHGAWHEPVTRWWLADELLIWSMTWTCYQVMSRCPSDAGRCCCNRIPDGLFTWSMTWTCYQVMISWWTVDMEHDMNLLLSRYPSDAGRCCCNRIPDELFTTWSMTWTCYQMLITWWTVDMEHDMNLLPGDEQILQWCW